MPKSLHTRKRVLPAFSNKGRWYTQSKEGTNRAFYADGSRRDDGRQITVSEGHHWPPSENEGFSDKGGPFSTVKHSVMGKYARRFTLIDKFSSSWQDYYYDGELSVNPSGTGLAIFPPTRISSDAALGSQGATAIARCQPTNSIADASTFLGELVKDGLPSIPGHSVWESRVNAAVKAGDEFLNIVFGWMPMVNDITKLGNAARHMEAVLAQYERDSGRNVRRTYNFPMEQEVSESVISTQSQPLVAGGQVVPHPSALPMGTLTRQVLKTRRQWFSGAFTYYLPSDYDSRRKVTEYASLADKLFGTSLTPDVLWELAPWSWAIDWFSNAGDVISNVSAWESAGLVLRYGYMMENTIDKYIYSFSYPPNTVNAVTVPDLTLVTESKVRVPANPFGFGVTWDGLSPFQASVLSALGITRVR